MGVLVQLISQSSWVTLKMASVTVPLLDDDTIAFGEEDSGPDGQKKFTHPYIVFFHLVFRCSALVIYILCGWFSDSFIASFVCVILLLSADFWTVKNITGRLLVGLRWWNYVDDAGKSHWVFEAKKGRINPHESRMFWLALIVCPLIWSVLFTVALFGFKFKWLLLVMISLTLNGANLYGYVKCKFGTKESLSSVTSDFVKTQIIQNAASFMSTKTPQPTTMQSTGVI
ncbi:putative Golgi apparatus membrane protein-like protein CG5021 isoform X3 [Arctopsyche grandis]|uniref:putative Golgi apparatus membrane protein-like protein CG5021 isoform X3 n=1 Tax=Arctopsyche grandis TaxID=121162 RepID=UPI00406D865B